jgi:hypothetical protein
MARKGQFKKGGGRVGGGTATRSRPRSSSKALVIVPMSKPASRPRPQTHKTHRKHHRKHHRRHGGGSGGVTLVKALVAAGTLANVADAKDGILGDRVYNLVQKLPGTKTFGGAVTAGLYLGAIHKFTRFGGRYRPWLAAAGLVGVIGAGLKLGMQGTGFKWLGESVMDVEA